MKKFFTFLLPLSLLALAALNGCNDNNADTPDPTPELPDGYTYATENTSINDGTVTANMLFFGTSTVTTIASGEEKTIDLSAASVTPEIKGTPFAKYVITNLTGEAARTELTVTFTCAGAFDVNYQGRLIIEK